MYLDLEDFLSSLVIFVQSQFCGFKVVRFLTIFGFCGFKVFNILLMPVFQVVMVI